LVKTPRFHGNQALNEIFSKGLGLPDMTHPTTNFMSYTIVEVFDEPLPILKKLFCHYGTKTSKMPKFIRKK
jgi:hypothetical protein